MLVLPETVSSRLMYYSPSIKVLFPGVLVPPSGILLWAILLLFLVLLSPIDDGLAPVNFVFALLFSLCNALSLSTVSLSCVELLFIMQAKHDAKPNDPRRRRHRFP